MTFRVGQFVECIDASAKHPLADASMAGLCVGSVYEVMELAFDKTHGEFVRVRMIYGFWIATRFRPIVEKQTDISFAHEILRKHTKKIGEKA